MGNIFNRDFQDFINSLNTNQVEYILVGGYSVVLHGYNRTTGDLDIWVNKTRENYHSICKAFRQFNLPLFGMTEDAFLSTEYDVFTYGRPPVSIDLMTAVKGLIFNEAYLKAEYVEIEDLKVKLIHLNDLLRAKKASNRHKDLDDIEHLEDK